jgi:hypothetical protein
VSLLNEVVEIGLVAVGVALGNARDSEANLGRHERENKGRLRELVQMGVIRTLLSLPTGNAEAEGMSTGTVAKKQMVPLLGMVWRGMWGAAAATAAWQVVADEETGDDSDGTVA